MPTDIYVGMEAIRSNLFTAFRIFVRIGTFHFGRNDCKQHIHSVNNRTTYVIFEQMGYAHMRFFGREPF